MKLNPFLLPLTALATGAALLLPAQRVEAFSTLGGLLNQNLRDFRIYNNFTDSTANNNQTPDSNFPGHQGAVMAIWKGSIEWGSELHGNGNGDPHQNGGLGSGGANFDPSFQAQAIEIGGPNDNIHSEIGGSSGGVLAYTEGGSGSGWRIRYYRAWTWDDGPTTSFPSSRIDLQGVACHEYGHALGLGHSTFGAATMYPSISGTGTSARSIHSDDIAGVQFVYGVKDSLKPRILDVTVIGTTIQVTGLNFDPTGNEIWFTQGSPGGDGVPIKVTDLLSNGTLLSATIPAGIGPGDLLVRRNGVGNKKLSNAWPVDMVPSGGCLTPINYCSSFANSGSAGAQISYANEPSLAANNFQLQGFGLPANKVGLFFYGPGQQTSLFGDGLLCVAGGIKRLSPQVTDNFGTVDRTLDFTSPPLNSGSGQAISGGTMNFQFWFRDPGFGTAGFNTTDGLQVTFCP